MWIAPNGQEYDLDDERLWEMEQELRGEQREIDTSEGYDE